MFESHKTIPCKNCICFAICNSIVQNLNGVYKSRFIAMKLGRKCCLISNWYYKEEIPKFNPSTYPHPDCVRELCRFYNIKYDSKPDYNLLTHIGQRKDNHE